MPRALVYGRWRKVVLQGVLCAVLVGTLGLASLVTRYKLRAGEVRLAPVVRFGDMGVRVPGGWEVEMPRGGVGGAVVVKAVEPVAGGRTLTVVRDHQDSPMPPGEYLLTSGLMSGGYAPSLGGDGKLSAPVETGVAGGRGYLVVGVRAVREGARVVARREVFATGMVPSRDVITVRLEGGTGEVGEDVELVRKVAAGVVVPSAGVVRGDVVRMPDGSTVRVPAGFVELPESDPHLTERHLVKEVGMGRWSGVTLVPCVFFVGADNGETFRTMLTGRDEEWLGAKVGGEGPVLRADLPVRAGLPYPRRAYLLTSGTGYALMVELHAGSAEDAAEWEGLLKGIAEGATAPTGEKPVELLKAGEEEVKRLRGVGLSELLAGVEGEQWWVWVTGGREVGWSRMTITPGEMSRGVLESRVSRGAGMSVGVRHEFGTSGDFSRHEDVTVRRDARVGSEPVDVLKEATSVRGGTYSMTLAAGSLGGRVLQATGRVPGGFLPGPWISALAGKLSRREMIFRSTRLMGLESQAATALVNVRVRPTTRPAGGFEVDLSGTGQVLVVSGEGVEFSKTDVRRRATEGEVRKAFGEAGMVPGK